MLAKARLSSRAQRGCGFTFEVQQLGKERLSWGLKAEAFSWGVVVGGDGCGEGVVVDGVEVCLARQGSSHAADGVFDGALLPGTVGGAEEGPHAERVGEAVGLSELGTGVEGDGVVQPPMERLEPGDELLTSRLGRLAGLAGQQERAGGAGGCDWCGVGGGR